MIAEASLLSAVFTARRKNANREGATSPRNGTVTTSPLWIRSRASAVSGRMQNAAAAIVVSSETAWRDGLRAARLLVGRHKRRPSRIDNPIFMFSICPARISLPSTRGNSIRNNRASRCYERHRRSDWFVFSAQAHGRKFQGALPVSSGKDPFIYREPQPADVSLLRLRRRRKRFQVRDGLRAHGFSVSGAQARGASRNHGSRKGRDCRWRSTI